MNIIHSHLVSKIISYQRTHSATVLGSDEFKNKIRKKPWKNIESEKLTKQLYGVPTIEQELELVSEKS